MVTFTSDDVYQTVTINLIDDQIVEETQSFGVTLEVDRSSDQFTDRVDEPVLIGDGFATVYIIDDDTMATACELEESDNIIHDLLVIKFCHFFFLRHAMPLLLSVYIFD